MQQKASHHGVLCAPTCSNIRYLRCRAHTLKTHQKHICWCRNPGGGVRGPHVTGAAAARRTGSRVAHVRCGFHQPHCAIISSSADLNLSVRQTLAPISARTSTDSGVGKGVFRMYSRSRTRTCCRWRRCCHRPCVWSRFRRWQSPACRCTPAADSFSPDGGNGNHRADGGHDAFRQVG